MEFQHIRILRRGHAFTRDRVFGLSIFADHDFLLHSDKTNMTEFYTDYIDTEKCRINSKTWELPLRNEIIIRNMAVARRLLASFDQYLANNDSLCIGIADIGFCWPHCTSTTDEYWREKFLNKVCRNASWAASLNLLMYGRFLSYVFAKSMHINIGFFILL